MGIICIGLMFNALFILSHYASLRYGKPNFTDNCELGLQWEVRYSEKVRSKESQLSIFYTYMV